MCFASAQGGGLLSEAKVAQPDLGQRQAGLVNLRHRAEKIHRLINGHRQHVGDVHSFVGDFECFAVVTPAVARLTGNIDRREEVHFDPDQAIALAFLAAAAFDVETEPAGVVTANSRRRELREQIANVVEHAGIGRRIAPRRAANRRLVYHDDLVQILDAPDFAVGAGPFF